MSDERRERAMVARQFIRMIYLNWRKAGEADMPQALIDALAEEVATFAATEVQRAERERDEALAAAHEVVSMPFALVDGDWTQHQMNGRFTAAMGRLRLAVTNAAEVVALTGAPREAP